MHLLFLGLFRSNTDVDLEYCMTRVFLSGEMNSPASMLVASQGLKTGTVGDMYETRTMFKNFFLYGLELDNNLSPWN
jgi:hypothetical protein